MAVEVYVDAYGGEEPMSMEHDKSPRKKNETTEVNRPPENRRDVMRETDRIGRDAQRRAVAFARARGQL